MVRAKEQKNGRLVEAMELLIQSQATLVQNQALFQAQKAETDRINGERFARIEAILLEHGRILMEHSRILADHTRILEALPDAIRRKIGFGSSEQQGAKE